MIHKNITLRSIVIFFISFLIIVIAYGCSTDSEIIYSDIDDYQTCIAELEGSEAFMPELNDLGNYESIELYCVEHVGVTVSINLIVSYSAENHPNYKKEVNADYDFLGHPLYSQGRTLIEDDRFDYNTFTINVVEAEHFHYPAQFGMIGVSSSQDQIAYMFFSDKSVISFEYKTMEDFVDSQFAFENKQ